MRITAPLILTLCALATAILSLVGDDSYGKLLGVRGSIEHQKKTNAKLDESVTSLKRQIYGLQNEDRALEKAARNELGMARPDEDIVIFDSSGQNGPRK